MLSLLSAVSIVRRSPSDLSIAFSRKSKIEARPHSRAGEFDRTTAARPPYRVAVKLGGGGGLMPCRAANMAYIRSSLSTPFHHSMPPIDRQGNDGADAKRDEYRAEPANGSFHACPRLLPPDISEHSHFVELLDFTAVGVQLPGGRFSLTKVFQHAHLPDRLPSGPRGDVPFPAELVRFAAAS